MPKANVQVTSEGGLPPSPERLAQAARVLSARGFQVLRVGRVGLLVQAEPAKFLEVLDVAVAPGAFSVPVGKADGEIRSLIERVEWLPDPSPLS